MSLGSSSNYPPQDDGEPARYDSSGNCGNNHRPQDDGEPSGGSHFNQPPPFSGEAGGKPGYAITEDYCEPRHVIHGKIIISFMILLIFVVVFFVLLCFYASWFWRQSANLSRRRSASRRRRFHFTSQEPTRLHNVGLDSAVLRTLPMFVYKSQNFTDGLDCAVCLCELRENEKARLLPNCGHSFHVECIDMWFLSHSTCPLCRNFIQPEEPILETVRVEMVSATIPDSIASVIHANLNSEQGQTAGSGDEHNRQNITNIFCCGRQEQGTSGGRKSLIMPQISIEIPNTSDGFSFPGEGHQVSSPNGSILLTRDTERIQVFRRDNPGERDVENNGRAQGQ